MNLLLMRHCRPVRGARDDAERELTEVGRKQAEQMAAWLARIAGHVDTVITSPYMRALQTAEIMAEVLGAHVQRTPMLDPDGKPEEAWRAIEAMSGYYANVLVVSHHPLIGHLVDQVAGMSGMGHTFEHGSIALVDTYAKEMHWLVNPSLVETDDGELLEAAADLAEAIVSVAEIDAPIVGGLKHPRHAAALSPIRAKATKVLRRFFSRQRSLLLTAIKPKLRESDAKDKAAQIIPDLLPISVTGGTSYDYSKALTAALNAGYTSLGEEISPDGPIPEMTEDIVQKYLSDHSLTKLTGDIDPTTVDRLRGVLSQAYEAGADYDGLVEAVKETYDQFSDVRAGLIAQTEMNAAYNAGRKQLGIDLGFNEKAWDPDGTACEEICVPNVLGGWIAMDEDFESGDDAPPGHPNCLLPGTLVSASGISAHTARRFCGEVVVIGTSGNQDLSVTPYHPILTGRGLLPAQQIKLSDYLVECLDPRALFMLMDPHNEYMESGVEKIANALIMASGVVSRCVPVSAEAFHGEIGTNGQVDIVRSASSMRINAGGRETFQQLGKDLVFGSVEFGRMPLDADSALAQILEAANTSTHGIMRGSGLSGTLGLCHFGSSDDCGAGTVALLESEALPCTEERGTAKASTFGDFQHALSGHVRLVKINSLVRRNFDGHVYNLETALGFYCANRIITHNCDCSLSIRSNPHAEAQT